MADLVSLRFLSKRHPTTNEVELRLEVDRTFVPAELPHSDNPDTRTLGVRVRGAYLTGVTRE